MDRNTVIKHPLEPFLPEGARLLMLGSFPPDRRRWSMDFFYPNFQNDMWRIFSLVFFGKLDAFIATSGKAFDKDSIAEFLKGRKIAMYDSAGEVVRARGTAADAHLIVKKANDIASMLMSLPKCSAVAATGRKAAENIAAQFSLKAPKTGSSVKFSCGGREFDFYVMPSSSRAYPMPILDKAKIYADMFSKLGML